VVDNMEAPTTEQTTEPTEEAPATEPTTEATAEETPAKPKRTRSPRKPKVQEPEPEPEPATKSYTAWVAPANRADALVMLRPAKGRGLILERDQAAARVKTNRERKDAGPTAPNTIQAIGWHDRTVAKVLIALGVVGTPSAKKEAQEVMAAAQKLTGFGTKTSITRPGKAAFAALEAGNAKKRPAKATSKSAAA
jgi:hypothetical protein